MSARPPETSAVAGVGLVTAGALTANVAAYLLHVPASRWLGLAGYSEFASLLSVQLLLAVPALALQTVVAREVARGADPGALRALQWRCAGIVAVVALALIPVVTAVLAVPAASAVSALVAAPVLVVLGGEQGLLQGAQRFAELAVVLAVTGVAKVVPAVLVLARAVDRRRRCSRERWGSSSRRGWRGCSPVEGGTASRPMRGYGRCWPRRRFNSR